MEKLRIVFMGTPNFAVKIVDEISKIHDVVMVVTQPDQHNNKKKKVIYSPVKQWALNNNIPIYQPAKIKKEYDFILKLNADLIVTAAYGQFIPSVLINNPKYGSINVHGSLLPKYRGGAPIQRAIINGERTTGISIMYMVKAMDAGDILAQKSLMINDYDNQDTLFERLSILGSEMINEVITDIVKGDIHPIKQEEAEVSFAPNLSKEDELIDFTKNANDVFNQIRGLASNPGGYFTLDNIVVKVYNSVVSENTCNNEPGVIVGINKKSFDISCKDGTIISILEVQLPSKNRMPASDFINGQGRKLLTLYKKVNEV